MSAHGVHFFKVITERTLQNGELQVPRSFQGRYWGEMTNPIFLRLPNNKECKVYWLVRDGHVWLKNGWQDFAKYSCLDVSHFCVFRYEGNSQFNVIVFDKSCLEIQYPSNQDQRIEEEDIDESKCKIVEDFSPEGSKGLKSPSSLVHTHKKMKLSTSEEEKEYDDEIDHDMKKSGNGERDMKFIYRSFHMKVKNLFSSRNVHFTCSIHKSYAERDLMTIPTSFSKLHLQKEGDSATLFINKQSRWDVELKLNNHGSLTFAGGWKKFCTDNNLKIGDVCAFEQQRKSNPISFKVTIFPFKEDSDTPLFEGHGGAGPSHFPNTPNKIPMASKVNGTWQNNEDFQVFIRPPFSYGSIPFCYIRGLFKENGYSTILYEDKEWKIKVLYYEKNSTARFTLGWAEFVKGCGLVQGDVCNFKLLDAEKHVFQLSSISKIKVIELD